MSTLTIATVTAVLKNLIENALVSRDVNRSIGGDTGVTVMAPDRIATGSEEKPQLNLFMYHVQPSATLRSNRIEGQPVPLAVELHYLLTAYGSQDYQTDILLGFALQLMHETPVLSGEKIGTTLRSMTEGKRGASPSLAALTNSDLATLVDQVRITPQFMDADGLSRLWSSLQAKSRPSVAYKVSVVPLGARGTA
jgi:hypothetical protein